MVRNRCLLTVSLLVNACHGTTPAGTRNDSGQPSGDELTWADGDGGTGDPTPADDLGADADGATPSDGDSTGPGDDAPPPLACVIATTFADVAMTDPFWSELEIVYRRGLLRPCDVEPIRICANGTVTRGEAARMTGAARYGANFVPAAATGVFADLPATAAVAPWAEKLYADGVVAGCNASPLQLCPDLPLDRRAVAVWLMKLRHGAAALPSATGIFSDVPAVDPAAVFVEQMYRDGLTAGCGANPLRFCPSDAVTRAQLAHFLTRAFDLREVVQPVATPTFADVPATDPLFPAVEALYSFGITAGCSSDPLRYCSDAVLNRASAAIMIERARHGSSYVFPPAQGLFADVSVDDPGAALIEAAYIDGLTAGCGTGPLRFCPEDAVTRAQVAVWLVKARHGAALPSTASGLFADMTLADPFTPFAEQLYGDGATSGCDVNPLRFCPTTQVTRGAMAALVARTFDLPLDCSWRQHLPRLPVNALRSVEYPGPGYALGCYHRLGLAGCFQREQLTADLRAIKARGFNTIWVPSFWRDFQPTVSPVTYDAVTFANLDQALSILADLDMFLITSPEYGVGGLFPAGYDESQWLIDDGAWAEFESFAGELGRRLAAHDNVYYIFFTEGCEPNRDIAAQPGPLRDSFRAWATALEDDVAFWNTRWGTTFASMADILPNPASNNGYNERFLDYQRWTGSLIRGRFPGLPAIVKAAHPGAVTIYHDYSLINLGWASGLWGSPPAYPVGAEAFLPLDPAANTFDAMSFVYYYPFSTATEIASALQERSDRFLAYYARAPAMLGETGLCSHGRTEAQRTELLQPVLTYVAAHGLGLNFWNWRDPSTFPVPSGLECEYSLGLLDRNASPKEPTAATLFPVP